ncbi:ENTH/VHS FAMILY PROTEIN-RELATED, partial [Salix koriyanagi]
MSVLSKSNGNYSTGTPSFHELKKQASFFFKGKIKSARLALTDVTPAELLTEEATHGNSWAPDNPTLGSISRAAFEVDDYWRIVGILHKRF